MPANNVGSASFADAVIASGEHVVAPSLMLVPYKTSGSSHHVVAGSAIFDSQDYAAATRALRGD